MSKDPILSVISKYRLPVKRNNQSIKEFLASYYKEYIKSIEDAIDTGNKEQRILQDTFYSNLTEKIPLIRENCADIIETLELYDGCDILLLNKHFDEMMEKIKGYLKISSLGLNYRKYKRFYRIRQGDSEYNRIDLFHIPMSKRNLITGYRYSIQGYPCLYLSTSLELCWLECGMPKKFSYSVFQLDNKDNKLIDFNTDPDNLLTDTYNYNQSESDRKIKKDREILRYLIIHPLRVACSLQVSNRNDSFIQEYIISQMLLLWVRKNNDFDGIAYHSCSAVEEAHNLNEYNVVFPAKDIKNDYCKRLSGIFQISKPIKVESCHIYKEFLSSIETVSEFTNDLEFIICNNNKLYLYNEVFSLCKSFLMIFDCLLNDKYYNAEVFYQTMFTFNIMSNIINENIEFFTQKVVDKFATTYPNCEKQNIVYEFLSVVNRFRKDIQPILFELQDFISNVKKYCKPDFLTLEYVNKDQIKLEEIKIEEKSLL